MEGMQAGEKRQKFIELSSPAKVNLLLSVHKKRGDGFHALSSLVVPLKYGDDLQIELLGAEATEDFLSCATAGVPLNGDNLILRAAEKFREQLGRAVYFKFELEKRIPMGAGLGGGSSNAAIALVGMNRLLGEPFDKAVLLELAACLGSDCPYFIDAKIAWMRGRGEILEPVDASMETALKGRQILLFKPDFGINTAWAYGAMAAGAPNFYETEAIFNTRVKKFASTRSLESLVYNSFEAVVGRKYISISTLLSSLREMGLVCGLSGSGSSCFVIPDAKCENLQEIESFIRMAWGDMLFFVETHIL